MENENMDQQLEVQNDLQIIENDEQVDSGKNIKIRVLFIGVGFILAALVVLFICLHIRNKKKTNEFILDTYFDALNETDLETLVKVLYPENCQKYPYSMNLLEADMPLGVYNQNADFVPEGILADYMRFDLDLMDKCYPGFKDAYEDRVVTEKELKHYLSGYEVSYQILDSGNIEDMDLSSREGLESVKISSDELRQKLSGLYDVTPEEIDTIQYYVLDVDFSVNGAPYGLQDELVEMMGTDKNERMELYEKEYSNFLIFVIEINGKEYVNSKLGYELKFTY